MSDIFCQFSEYEVKFRLDPIGNMNFPVLKLQPVRDFEDESLEEWGEFKLDTGADMTVIGEDVASRLGIEFGKWIVFKYILGINGERILARQGEVSFRIADMDVVFTIPVAVPVQSKVWRPLLGRAGIVGRFFIFLCKNGFCFMKMAEN